MKIGQLKWREKGLTLAISVASLLFVWGTYEAGRRDAEQAKTFVRKCLKEGRKSHECKTLYGMP